MVYNDETQQGVNRPLLFTVEQTRAIRRTEAIEVQRTTKKKETP